MAELPDFLRGIRARKTRLQEALEALSICEGCLRDCAAIVLELVPPDDDTAVSVRRMLDALDH